MPEIGWGCSCFAAFHVVIFQSTTDLLMPLDHLRVWFRRERIPWNGFWKIPSIWVPDVPDIHGSLDVLGMLVGIEQDLDCLPSHEAAGEQGWQRWRFERVVGRLLQTMITP